MTQGDGPGARGRLSSAERLLRERTSLLAAPWLMAERWRLESQLEARAGNADRASDLDQRADVLEGRRAAPFGQTSRKELAAAETTFTIAVRGALHHEAYWDGLPTPDQGRAARGEHHLAVLRGGRVRWSGWVELPTATAIEPAVPEAAPCSLEDLEGVALAGNHPLAPAGVRCPEWVVAVEGGRAGSIRVARCEREHCEALREWSHRPVLAAASETTGASPAPRSGGLPPWAIWTLAGVGTVATTTLLLWGLGVFDAPGPHTVVTYDGGHL